MLRVRQRIGKFRIEGRLAEGPLAAVYKAYDTIHGAHVALKVPHESAMDEYFLQDFRREAQLAERLEHENILPIKDASIIDGRFVIVMPLGRCSLADRMQKRISEATVRSYTEQALTAVAHAHECGIIHCDIKPDNFIVFPGDRLRLTDFGFSKIARRAMQASGSGTVGYIAPEQAAGRPMYQSDVFSLALVIYELHTGELPGWPYAWPPAGIRRLRQRMSPAHVEWLRKALQLRSEKRHRNAQSMQREYLRLRNGRSSTRRQSDASTDDPELWRSVLFRQFQRKYGKSLGTTQQCASCSGPVAQEMQVCPWCAEEIRAQKLKKSYPAECPRCGRGSKLDWRYCAWCYGSAFEVETTRHYPDKRYDKRCSHASCRGPLMPFMKYCPWCRKKVSRSWPLPKGKGRCPSCSWGVDTDYWTVCPWCTTSLS